MKSLPSRALISKATQTDNVKFILIITTQQYNWKSKNEMDKKLYFDLQKLLFSHNWQLQGHVCIFILILEIVFYTN